jgi:hypothetical protein
MRLNASEYEGLSVGQRIKLFDNTHGPDFIIVDRTILYADGAFRDLNPYGVLAEPPLDEKKCNESILKFIEAKYNLAREEFQVFKNNLRLCCENAKKYPNCSNPPQPPSAEAVAKLKELQKKVHHWQGKLTAARKKLEESIPEHIVKRNEFCEETRRKATSISAEIENIKI